MKLLRLVIGSVLCPNLMLGAAWTPDSLEHLPLAFVPADRDQETYIAKGSGYSLQVSARENVLALSGAGSQGLRVRTRFARAEKGARMRARDPLPSHTNFFVGASPQDWRTNIPNYSRLRVDGLYRGVDLVFYGSADQLEYDFIVHPGADPHSIQFDLDGAESIAVDSSGDLILSANKRQVRWKTPVLYQYVGGKRMPVNGGFKAKGHRVSFDIGTYDRTRELVIDPVLSYATYVGGSHNDSARAIATDPAGNVYVAGATNSMDLRVTAQAIQTAFGGQTSADFSGDAFVAKYSPTGTLLYLTFLGGKADDFATAIAVDASGNAYVTGMTNSADFPIIAGAFQKSFAGSGGNSCEHGGDAFVAKLNTAGSQLVYSTYLGGTKDDAGTAIAIDSIGNAYIAGTTISTDFPIANALQPALSGIGGQEGRPYCGGTPWFNTGDAFVTKLNPAGSGLVFSTYLGGKLDDFAFAIAVDADRNVYVAGSTLSRDFPVSKGAFQTAFHGIEGQNFFWNEGDAFVAKLSSSGGSLLYATYLGGSGDEAILGIATGPNGTLWVTGNTSSTDFPVTNGAIQGTYAGYTVLPFSIEQLYGDAFVAQLNSDGTGLVYCTYLGGLQNDAGTSIAVDNSGLVYVAGFTDSFNFPFTVNALQKTMAGDGGAWQYYRNGDGFVAVIDPVASKLIYNSYYGGSFDDQFLALALDGAGGVWASGVTASRNLPLTNDAAQKTFSGIVIPHGYEGDSFLVHFTGLAPFGPVINAVVNGASFAPGGVVAGEIATIFGTNLTSATGINLAAGLPLATTLLEVSLSANGTAAPLFAVDNVNGQQQINFQVPWEVAGAANATIAITTNAIASPAIVVPVLPAQPGIFYYTVGADNFGAILHANFQLADSAHPAKSGETVLIFCTGLGAVDSPPDDGVAGNGQDTKVVPVVAIGGVNAKVSFSGLAPDFVGLYQVNAEVPAGLKSGNQMVTIMSGNASSTAVLLPIE